MSAVTDAIGSIAGSAASGPIGIIGSLLSKALDFIPDPAKKLEFQQHIQDQQLQLAMATIDQQNKQAEIASKNIQNDKLSGPRAGFCWMVVGLLAWNYGLCPMFHRTPVNLPFEIVGAFTALLLGMSGMSMAREVALAPGDSQVNLLGVKVANKS